ncbi:MAG TPA: pyridoxamine 5'-phosphate oxidase family protein [Candidatus Saccharimonadales bacterium]|nr:pyridoxamine 5'-phosphate oxidase family protein [Candidatus Saccharimonadales bacterium]
MQILAARAVHARSFSERQKRIYDFLNRQRTGVLSTVTPDNNPHGVVVYYAIEDDFVISFLTKKGTHKYDNLIHNDHVMLTVYEPLTQTTAQITGRAIERDSQRSVARIAGAVFGDSLRKSSIGLPPIVKLQAGAFTAFQIEPTSIRLALYARPEPGDYAQLFESIESFEYKEGA